MNQSVEDKKRDDILKRMLKTPPAPKQKADRKAAKPAASKGRKATK